MSRSIKGRKACGYDYWSRRPYSGHGHGRKIKDICHGMERAQERKEIFELLEQGDPYYMMMES